MNEQVSKKFIKRKEFTREIPDIIAGLSIEKVYRMPLVLLLLVLLLAQYPRVIVSGDSYKEDEVVVTSVYKPSNCEIKVSTGETVNVRYKAFIHETSVSGVANSIVDQSKGLFKYKLGSSGKNLNIYSLKSHHYS